MSSPYADAQRQKRKLRREHRDARSQQGEAARQSASERIARHVIYSRYFQRSRRIACYLPMPDEVDTWPIIARAWRMKKKIFAPITDRNRLLTFREIRPESDLATTDFGLLEPVSGAELTARELDLVLVPMVAFDDDCLRIGMGGGYYDRTFSFLRARRRFFRPKLVGLAFASQRVDKVPSNPWDIRLFRIITEFG
ncbi:MAG: 5-formyltetrahydrofolate cyclo-ligase [Woeseiaceae bacterium]